MGFLGRTIGLVLRGVSKALSSYTCAELNDPADGLTIAQRNIIQNVYPIISGQTTVYRTDDNGTYQTGRLVTFTTLDCFNGFGVNTNRFTDDTGAQTYTNNLVVDWATGLMWYRIPRNISATYTWNVSIDELSSLAYGGFSWRLPTNMEAMLIVNATIGTYVLNYSPFNLITTDFKNLLWCGTTSAQDTTRAYCINISGGVIPNFKTLNGDYIPCRTFTLADLGL